MGKLIDLAKKGKLVVCNPPGDRWTPAGVPIMEYADGRQFYEGDVFEIRPATTEAMLERRVSQGFLREV